MTDEQKSAAAADIYAALTAAEAAAPSPELTHLHRVMYLAFERYIAANTGVVRPYDGTPKPPQ